MEPKVSGFGACAKDKKRTWLLAQAPRFRATFLRSILCVFALFLLFELEMFISSSIFGFRVRLAQGPTKRAPAKENEQLSRLKKEIEHDEGRGSIFRARVPKNELPVPFFELGFQKTSCPVPRLDLGQAALFGFFVLRCPLRVSRCWAYSLATPAALFAQTAWRRLR